MFNTQNKFIIHKTGDKPGPTTIIQGCTHGNEKIGKSIIDKLASDITQEKISGSIILILGNPQAYEKNKRFIDEDLNRLLNKILRNDEVNTYEKKRVLEIIPYYKKIDYLLDIHSTITPSVPFVYCEDRPKQRNLAGVFNTEYIISAHEDINSPELRTCFDSYADKQGGIGLTYEAGQIGNEESERILYQKTLQFLEQVGNIKSSESSRAFIKHPSKHLIIVDHLWTTGHNFKFLSKPYNFQKFKKDEVIALEGNKPIRAPRDCYLIFPKIDPHKDRLAGYIARKKEN